MLLLTWAHRLIQSKETRPFYLNLLLSLSKLWARLLHVNHYRVLFQAPKEVYRFPVTVLTYSHSLDFRAAEHGKRSR